MVPKMEQRVIYNIYNEPKACYRVTDGNGTIEEFLSHNAAYRRLLFLLDDQRIELEQQQRKAYLKRLAADIELDPVEELYF